jgi:uncharacterized membrane protein YhaH (DUF805 family)
MSNKSSANGQLWPWNTWLKNLFGFQTPVRQIDYALFGFGLMLLKYGVEAGFIYCLTGQLYTPLDFVNPLLVGRQKFTADAPLWLGMGWVLWTLPFLWIAVSMSVRRAAKLNFSPWWGLLVMFPVVNLFLMLLWAGWPDRQTESNEEATAEQALLEIYSPPETRSVVPFRPQKTNGFHALLAAIYGILGGALFLVLSVVFSTYFLESYGAVMFFATPVLTGAIAAYALNHGVRTSLAATLGHSALTLCFACAAFLFFGIEGAICIAMAVPIMVPLGMLGACMGYAIASGMRGPNVSEHWGLWGSIFVLPLCGAVEAQLQPVPTFEIKSEVVIQADAETVWKNVVQFSDITETPEWYFRLGFSTPLRARIEGAGVGAIRHCEFTTGDFVEPITHWEEPTRLAFDVTEQPEPMFELTPYRHIHPPHLKHSFRSQRGEFRIVPLSASEVRLEGRTWYQLQIYPLAYWTVWTDWIVHRIHERVLRHIKQAAERAAAQRAEQEGQK